MSHDVNLHVIANIGELGVTGTLPHYIVETIPLFTLGITGQQDTTIEDSICWSGAILRNVLEGALDMNGGPAHDAK